MEHKPHLIVVDMQPYFLKEILPTRRQQQLVTNVGNLCAQFTNKGYNISLLEIDSDRIRGPTIHEVKRYAPFAREFKKRWRDGFEEEDFYHHVHELNPSSNTVVGVYKDLCVEETAKSSANVWPTHLVSDCMATWDENYVPWLTRFSIKVHKSRYDLFRNLEVDDVADFRPVHLAR